jgi:hypothetical protein
LCIYVDISKGEMERARERESDREGVQKENKKQKRIDIWGERRGIRGEFQ